MIMTDQGIHSPTIEIPGSARRDLLELTPLLPCSRGGARIRIRLALCLALAMGCFHAAAQESAGPAAARKIFADRQDSLVWLSTVAKIMVNSESARDGGINLPDREQKMEGLGTVVEASGLTVTALSSIDPSRELSGREVRTRNGMMKLEASAVLKDVKIILADGTEVPAEVVMRDADLDLAFVRPKAGSKELKEAVFKPIDLRNSAKGHVTEDAITLSRTDEVLNRQPSVTVGQITTVTIKPREFLRATGASAGCPTFSVEGKLLGIAASRTVKGKGSMLVLVPAADVLEVAEEAKNAKAPVEEDSKTKPVEKEEK